MPAASPKSWTIDDLVDSWERHLTAGNLSPHTLNGYRSSLSLFAHFLTQEGLPEAIHAITARHVEAYLADVLGHWTAHTAATRYIGIQQFFRWCVAEDLLPTSPMEHVTKPALPETMRRVLSDEQLKALLKTCADTKDFVAVRDTTIIRLFLDTGVRLAELTKWTQEGLDWQTNSFDVLGKGRGGGKERFVAFGAQAAKVLDRYLRLRKQHKYDHLPQLWLCNRGAFSRSGIQNMLTERGKAAGIAHMHPHLLRHTFIDRMKRSGMSEENIMQLTGHASTSVFQHYAKSLRSERAREEYKGRAPGDRL